MRGRVPYGEGPLAAAWRSRIAMSTGWSLVELGAWRGL